MSQMVFGEEPEEPPVPGSMTYEDFFPSQDVWAFKRVKRGSMRLSRVARSVVADMVGGTLVQFDDSRKEYLTTKIGRFRLAMSHASDNQTEMREHARLGAEVIVMGDETEMARFFRRHGHDGTVAFATMKVKIREELLT